MPVTRQEGLTRAVRLEMVTIAWMAVEAGVSVGAGVAARSLLLVAFGIDSVVELGSAFLLLHRLRREAGAQPHELDSIEALEQRAAKVSGWLLFALTAYVIIQALYGLVYGHQAETSWWGIGVALIAALGMPVLARAKIRVADQIGSRALRADAMETFTCGYLSWMLLAGLMANALLHWWWLDSAASLLIVPFLVREAREAISREGCSCECH